MQIGKDAFTAWVVAGVIGVAVRDTYSYFAKLVGFAKFQIWQVGANIFLEKSSTSNVWGTVTGLLNDLVVGAMLGVMLGILLAWTGRANYLLKGMGVGLFAWIFFFGILFHNLPAMDLAPKDAMSSISAFVGHSIYGIVTAWIGVKLAPEGFFVNSGENNRKKDAAPDPATEFVGGE